MDNIYGSWTSLLPLLFSPAPSSPSSHVFSSTHCHPHPFPCYCYSPVTQLSSTTFKALLYLFNFSLGVSLQHLHYQWTIVTFSASNEPLCMHSFTLLQIFTSPSILPSSSSNTTASLVLVSFGGWYFTARRGCLLPSGELPAKFQMNLPMFYPGYEAGCTSDVSSILR